MRGGDEDEQVAAEAQGARRVLLALQVRARRATSGRETGVGANGAAVVAVATIGPAAVLATELAGEECTCSWKC